MKRSLVFTILIISFALATPVANAQIFKKKKRNDVQSFAPGSAEPRDDKAQMVSPIREFLNNFNLQIEKGYGFFLYQNELTDVSVIRNPRGDQLFIVPLGQEGGNSGINAYSNWFNDLTPLDVFRVDDDAQVARTDTTSFAFQNNGRINPWTLRLSFSLKKVDKLRLKTTGDRVMSDDEFLRVGLGVSSGSLKFRNTVNYQDVDARIGEFTLPQTEISTSKIFGSLTYNAYSLMDVSFLVDVAGGIWRTKKSDMNQDLVTYDPFLNIGFIMEKTVSKYFKLYIRPSFEMRSYSLSNEVITTNHSLNVFTVDIGALIKYPTYPRNRHGANRVQMEHVFNGRIYRGRSIFRPQNPRTGQFGQGQKKN